MKITFNQPNRLVVEERPGFFAAILAMFFLAVIYGLIDGWRRDG